MKELLNDILMLHQQSRYLTKIPTRIILIQTSGLLCGIVQTDGLGPQQLTELLELTPALNLSVSIRAINQRTGIILMRI